MHGNRNYRFFSVLSLVMLGVLTGLVLKPYLHLTVFRVMMAIGIVFLFIAVYYGIRIYLAGQRELLKTSSDEKKTEVGFVVSTFHELVGKLKEKEKELERHRAQAEDRAFRVETYNENVLQSVPSGVMSIDNEGRIKSINQSAEKTLGVAAKDVIDRDCAEVFNEPLLGIITQNRSLHRGEYSYVTKNGRNIWLGVTTSQLKNAAHETIGLILVFTDLTDIKALRAQVELKERLTQLGEMSAGIAHELRTPMSVISGYAKLLNRRVEAAEKSTVQAILAEIENMDRIISEFLAFAKPTDLNCVPVDLKRLLEETAGALTVGDAAIRAAVSGDDPGAIMADELLLRQAFTNLFLNAVEAMPNGGTLDIHLRRAGDKVVIRVKDTGHGIPEGMLKKIFLPFFTSKEKGIGLGLAIAQKVIVSHGGSIDVESRAGEGAVFSIILPALP